MKNLLLATAISMSIPLCAFAQTVTPMHEVAGVPLVEVSVNGTGPYPFVLDTGASVTMVKGPLFQALKIAPRRSVIVAGSLGEGHQQQALPGSLAVAGLGADDIEVDMLEEGQLGVLEGHAQGILGENFLKHFDVLIDNERHALTLDRTNRLARSLAGERLPLSIGDSAAELTHDRLIVRLRAPSLVGRSMLFLVDSGANTAVVYPLKNETLLFTRGFASGSIQSLDSDQICRLARTPLTIGSQTYRQAVMAICENRRRDSINSDGLLPTRLFGRLFISHRDKYLIANPKAASKDKDRNIKLAEAITENVTSP